MKTVRHWFKGLVIVSSVSFGLSCSNTKTEEALTPASMPAEQRTMPASSGGELCPGDRPDEPRECKSDEDCCAGFECGFDHGRSHVIRFCLQG